MNNILELIYPLSTKIDLFEYVQRDEDHKGWFVREDFQIVLPGITLNTIETNFWRTHQDTITIKSPYFWNGTTCPGLDQEDGALASLVHDIVCARINNQYAVSVYLDRHCLYYAIAKAQGMLLWKREIILYGLICFNWIYAYIKRTFFS